MRIELRRLFEIKSGDYHALHELAPGTVPLVSCGDINHGFVGLFDVPLSQRYADAITVAYNGLPLTSKYRPYEFAAKDDIGILLPRQKTDALSLVYVAALLNALCWRYSYGRKCFKEKLRDLVIDVPIRTNGRLVCIDDDQIQEFLAVSHLDMRPPRKRGAPASIKRTRWVRRRLDEIFHLTRGDFHSLGVLGSGSWATVSRTTNDNGVAGYYERPDGSNVYPPGIITVSSVGGDAFVQPREFIATDNVIVLRPIRDMPLEMVVLIAAMVNQQKWRYSYGRQCYQQKLSAMTVVVPWEADGLDHDAARSIVRQQAYWEYFRRVIIIPEQSTNEPSGDK